MISDTNPSRNRTFSPELDKQDAMKRRAYTMNRKNKMPDPSAGLSKYGLDPEWDLNAEPRHEMPKAGPNRWDEMTQDDFAKDFDFVLSRQGSITVIDPKSEAALQWCYRFLPEDCPRWGARGFAIETNYLGPILHGMARDNLISDEEYEFRMNAEERDRMAGEDQE